MAAAIALGNAVVLKPHQNTPVCGGGLVAKVFEDAGLPAGVLNVVITDIAEIGDALIEHPVPKVISFTGSDKVGRQVATVAAAGFKRTVLELGGDSAMIVLDDADVDYAVDAAVVSRFAHQGQICTAANRVLVARSIEREFTEKFVAQVKALKVGDPRDPETHIGPLINEGQAEAIGGMVEQIVADGATALVRGTVEGTMVGPTVLTDVNPDSAVYVQEFFGPVVMLIPFDGEEEALRIANETSYGAERRRAHRRHRARRAAGPQGAYRNDPRQRRHRARRADRPVRRREVLRRGAVERRGDGGLLHHHEVDLHPARPHQLPLLTRPGAPAPSRTARARRPHPHPPPRPGSGPGGAVAFRGAGGGRCVGWAEGRPGDGWRGVPGHVRLRTEPVRNAA